MAERIRIDLHTHSTASDGTATPAEVVEAAAAAGLDVVALTDHDTTSGWQEAAAALRPGMTLVPGAELSCRWVDDAGRRLGIHLLGYLFDPDDPALGAQLATVRSGLESRALTMVDLLRADGVDIPWDEVREIAGGDTVGRPHIAQALVDRGVVESVDEAFEPRWLGRRYHVPKQATDVFDAVRLVVGAGGVPVLAHPRRRDRVVPPDLVARLAEQGLFGIEVDHPEHTEPARLAVGALAAELVLVTTGSSDFHGTRKTVRIGANTTDPEVYEKIVAAATGCAPISAS